MVTCSHLCQQRPSDYGIPMDVEMAYVQDSFLTNDILHEMVSSVLGGGLRESRGRGEGTEGPQLDRLHFRTRETMTRCPYQGRIRLLFHC